MNKKDHWENIYSSKKMDEVSWFQEAPVTLPIITELLEPSKSFIDIGGGDGFLVDTLLRNGYKDVSVLDISANAIEKAKSRLGEQVDKVNWIVSDILQMPQNKKYFFWHDRAVFHFLTSTEDKRQYVRLVSDLVAQDGYFMIGTFSENGPLKCSGIEICRYSTDQLVALFEESFSPIKSFKQEHQTPFGTTQEFSFVLFTKK